MWIDLAKAKRRRKEKNLVGCAPFSLWGSILAHRQRLSPAVLCLVGCAPGVLASEQPKSFKTDLPPSCSLSCWLCSLLSLVVRLCPPRSDALYWAIGSLGPWPFGIQAGGHTHLEQPPTAMSWLEDYVKAFAEGTLTFETSRPTWVSVQDVVLNKTKDRPRNQVNRSQSSATFTTHTSNRKRCLCSCCYGFC